MNEFIENFKEALDVEGEFNLEKKLNEIDEWDSMGYISMMAMIDEKYGKVVSANQLKKCETIGDLYKLI
jgi:acyl carrier protein